MALDIQIGDHMGSPFLTLTGRISDSDARELSHEVHVLFKAKNDRIIIDISRVIFMDSHGLGVIVYYSSLMKKDGRQLIMLNTNRNPTSYMNRLFDMTNLDKVLFVVGALDMPY